MFSTGTTAPATGGFTFGSAAPAPATTSGFSFGAAAPSTGSGFTFGSTGSAPAATTSGFSFGAAAPATTSGFSFGAAAPAAPATTSGFSFGAAAPATTSGFSFGAAAPAAPATTSGFSFGSAAPAAPATGGFSFGSGFGASAAPATGGFGFGSGFGASAAANPQPPLTIPAPAPYIPVSLTQSFSSLSDSHKTQFSNLETIIRANTAQHHRTNDLIFSIGAERAHRASLAITLSLNATQKELSDVNYLISHQLAESKKLMESTAETSSDIDIASSLSSRLQSQNVGTHRVLDARYVPSHYHWKIANSLLERLRVVQEQVESLESQFSLHDTQNINGKPAFKDGSAKITSSVHGIKMVMTSQYEALVSVSATVAQLSQRLQALRAAYTELLSRKMTGSSQYIGPLASMHSQSIFKHRKDDLSNGNGDNNERRDRQYLHTHSYNTATPISPAILQAVQQAGAGLPGVPGAAAPASTGFSFGSSAAAPASTGFSFGSSAAAPASTGFSFGSAAPAAPATTSGFSFGSAAPAAPATTSGFSFGAAAPAAPAATSGFSFGAAAPAAPAATSGFSFGSAAPAAPASSAFSFAVPATPLPTASATTAPPVGAKRKGNAA